MSTKTLAHEYVDGICTICGETQQWVERDQSVAS